MKNKDHYKNLRIETFNRKRVEENRRDKSGHDRPLRPVKDKAIKATDINFEVLL